MTNILHPPPTHTHTQAITFLIILRMQVIKQLDVQILNDFFFAKYR
jgi:hypothetical protein